ncbi:hypothetical protein, partial [Kitasatospora purpeofusca]|uniref:hypothetical protein n=1 Tax=Kitasatospora purpeofusca TaxID=67352 RepID=UPI0036568FE4
VVLASGGFAGRGGSSTQPALGALDGTVLEIRDVLRPAVDFDDRRVTLVDDRVDLEALLAERRRLRARLTEIDAVPTAHGRDED